MEAVTASSLKQDAATKLESYYSERDKLDNQIKALRETLQAATIERKDLDKKYKDVLRITGNKKGTLEKIHDMLSQYPQGIKRKEFCNLLKTNLNLTHSSAYAFCGDIISRGWAELRDTDTVVPLPRIKIKTMCKKDFLSFLLVPHTSKEILENFKPMSKNIISARISRFMGEGLIRAFYENESDSKYRHYVLTDNGREWLGIKNDMQSV